MQSAACRWGGGLEPEGLNNTAERKHSSSLYINSCFRKMSLQVTRSISQKIKGKLHQARVVMSVGNTVWVDPMVGG